MEYERNRKEEFCVNDWDGCTSTGGAMNHSGTVMTPKSHQRGDRGTGFLCFTCAVCFLLSVTCTFLGTLVVLDQNVEAASYRYGKKFCYSQYNERIRQNRQNRIHHRSCGLIYKRAIWMFKIYFDSIETLETKTTRNTSLLRTI